jgi:RecQ family ATP-dependent DNA helicase
MTTYFNHLQEYLLAVCKECRHGVLPSHIARHLIKAHKLSSKDAQLVAEEVEGWGGLVQYASEVQVPETTIRPIPELPVFTDGQLCHVEPERCRRVFRSAEVLRKHWREVHGWSAGHKKGRPSTTREKVVHQRTEQASKTVHCQRLFVQGTGSQYFEVSVEADTVPANHETAWQQLRREMKEAWARVQDTARNTIQDGERDEVNPWLERTQWLVYLKGLQRPDLLACVEEPMADGERAEPIEAAMWEAMGGLARLSQQSVIDRIGVFVRLEAIRTEKHQTLFQPLQPYMDEASIVRHARPWQQILMFFARTQREHPWRSPKYRLTRRQRAAWDAFVQAARGTDEVEEMDMDEVDEMDIDEVGDTQLEAREDIQLEAPAETATMTPIQEACLEFCITLLDQSVSRREYDNALVCALAVLGVREDGWKGAESYPPILSAVIKVARFMVVQKALNMSPPEEDEGYDSDNGSSSDSDSGSSSNSAEPPRKGCLQFVSGMMDKFMVRGSHGPMQWMLDLRTYGLKIHYNTTAQGHVEWAGRDELLYKDIQFNMAQFRSMVHGLETEARRMLHEELLFGDRCSEAVPGIPWEQLRDDPSNKQPGWNFLQDKRTSMPVNGQEWLWERIVQNPRLRDRFMKPGSRMGIDRQEVERYMSRVVAFREKLIVLTHLTGGQPGRGPEVMSIRHSNTIKGEHRNMFIEDGMVVFATRYHKGYAVKGDIKIIHRYLPREVGELVVWYMWLVLPFQQQLEAMVWKRETMSSHMWPADPNGRKWTSDRFREALKRESRVGLGQELTIAAYREIAIGISRKFLRRSTAFQSDDGEEEQEAWDSENIASIIADLQAGHTPHVAGMIYARGLMEMSGAVADKRMQFRMSSMDWHRFLGFESGQACKEQKRAPFEEEADEARFDRWARMQDMDATAALKRMVGEKATFRGVQQEAIEAIVAGESPVVAVMPTGAGKSMLFMLPAWVEQGGTTVVVVPLIALRGDMMRRCRELGIACAEWESRHPPDSAAVVMVTPESAVGEGFTTFLNRLRATRQLDRIVIDECHIVLNRRFTFRKKMQQLGKLVGAETQIVMLTATLPPSEEDELFQRMHFEQKQVKMFRDNTARTNIAYSVVRVGKKVNKKEVEEIVVRTIEQKRRKHRTGKMIIYGNNREKVEQLARRVGCKAYHAETVDRAQVLEEFMAGKQQMIVATSALGMGVDIADIRCIIHVEWPLTLLDYAQESGRAGRDGQRSEAVVIAHEGGQWRAKDSEEEMQQARVWQLVDGVEGRATCRRVILDGYLDRRERERTQCEEGEAKCDVCRGGQESEEESEEEMDGDCDRNRGEEEEGEEEEGGENSEVEREAARQKAEEKRREQRVVFEQQRQERRGPRQRWMAERQQEFGEVEWLERQLAWWVNRCGVCEGAGDIDSGHDIRQCRRADGISIAEMVRQVDKEIRYEQYAACYGCGVPQAVCNTWEDNEKGGYRKVQGRACQYRGVLTGSIYGISMGYPEIGVRWAERLHALVVDGQAGVYLGRMRRAETIQASNLVGEFCWITRAIQEQGIAGDEEL